MDKSAFVPLFGLTKDRTVLYCNLRIAIQTKDTLTQRDLSGVREGGQRTVNNKEGGGQCERLQGSSRYTGYQLRSGTGCV